MHSIVLVIICTKNCIIPLSGAADVPGERVELHCGSVAVQVNRIQLAQNVHRRVK